MRRAGRLVAEVLGLVGESLRPGVSTAHLDEIAEKHIRKAGGVPSVQGLQRLPVLDLHLDRPRGCPRDSRPPDQSAMDMVVSIDAAPSSRVTTATRRVRSSWATFRRPSRPVATTAVGLEAGIAAASPATGSGTSLPRGGRRPSTRVWRGPPSSGTGSAPRCTRIRRSELPHQDEGIELGARNLPGDRADVHPGECRRRDASPTAGQLSPATVPSRPTRGIRSPSPRTARDPHQAVAGRTGACRNLPNLIRLHVRVSARVGARPEQSTGSTLARRTQSKSREPSSSRCRTRCSPASWRMAPRSCPTAEAPDELHPDPAGDRVRVELSPFDLTRGRIRTG